MENQKNSKNEVCTLAKGTIIEGTLSVGTSMRLEGKINGDVKCGGKLVMSPDATIIGEVNCQELESQGQIQGNIKSASNVLLHPTARIEGDIECTGLQIDGGAQFNGQCMMKK